MGSYHKNIQLMLEFLQGSILGTTLFLPYVNDLSDDFICKIANFPDNITLYSKCAQASDL